MDADSKPHLLAFASETYRDKRRKIGLQISMGIGSRIRELRLAARLSQRQLGRLVGVSSSAVTQWECDATIPEARRFADIAAALRVPTEELIKVISSTGLSTNGAQPSIETQPKLSDADPTVKKTLPAIALLPRDLPVLGVTVGGQDGDFSFNGETVDFVRRPPGVAPSTFALYVQGDSMFPRFKRGELVFCSDARPPGIGDDIVIEMSPAEGDAAGACYIKELVKVLADRLVVREYEPKKRDFNLMRRNIKRIWRIYSNAELLGSG